MSPKNQVPVRDMDTGQKWPSMAACAKDIGVSTAALSFAISAHRGCKGRWICVDGDEPILCTCCALDANRRKAGLPSIKQEVEAMVG